MPMLQEVRSSAGRLTDVVVSGAAGFVGRHVVASLIGKGYRVTALVHNLDKARSVAALRAVDLIPFELSSHELPQGMPSEAALIHCAWGDARDHESIRHIEEHLPNSYRFIRKAVAHGISTVIVTGTSWEYGKVYGPVHAAATPQPATPYATSKHALHLLLRSLQKHLSFKLIWARIFQVYGDGDHPQGLIGLFDKALENGERNFNMSLGEQLYDYLPIEAGADQLTSLLDATDGTYNVCSGRPVSLRRLLEERMRAKQRHIELNLGFYPYRERDTIAIWGADPLRWQNRQAPP